MGLLDGLTGASTDSFISYIGDTLWWFGIIFWVVLVIGILIFFWYLITFNIPTHVYETVGDKHILRFLRRTRSKIFSKNGALFLKVYGVKANFEPPQSDDYQLGRKGKLLNLIKEGIDFKPFRMSVNPGHITIQQNDVRFWAAQAMKDETIKYSELSFFQKYGAYMVFIFGMLILGWMFYIMITTVGADVDKNLAIAEKVADTMKSKIAGP